MYAAALTPSVLKSYGLLKPVIPSWLQFFGSFHNKKLAVRQNLKKLDTISEFLFLRKTPTHIIPYVHLIFFGKVDWYREGSIGWSVCRWFRAS